MSQSKWTELRRFIRKNRPKIRKAKNTKCCKMRDADLDEMYEFISKGANTRKRKRVTKTSAANKARKVTLDLPTTDEDKDQYGDDESEYRSDEPYDEDIVYGMIRNMQNIDRREQYHVDQYGVSESVIRNNTMDISSTSDSDLTRNHNGCHSSSDVDTEQEYAMEENYCYRTRQKKRKPCTDHQQYLLQ